MIVALHGAEFFAHHGFYPEEQKLGSYFVVDIEVSFTPTGDIAKDDINDTVNYEKLYDIVCEEMKQPKKLIETVAQAIITRVQQQYTFVESIQVVLKKLNPLVGAKTKNSSVTLEYVR